MIADGCYETADREWAKEHAARQDVADEWQRLSVRQARYLASLPAPTPEQQAAQEARHLVDAERIANACRAYLCEYDEFYPKYPTGLGEVMDKLIAALDATGD